MAESASMRRRDLAALERQSNEAPKFSLEFPKRRSAGSQVRMMAKSRPGSANSVSGGSGAPGAVPGTRGDVSSRGGAGKSGRPATARVASHTAVIAERAGLSLMNLAARPASAASGSSSSHGSSSRIGELEAGFTGSRHGRGRPHTSVPGIRTGADSSLRGGSSAGSSASISGFAVGAAAARGRRDEAGGGRVGSSHKATARERSLELMRSRLLARMRDEGERGERDERERKGREVEERRAREAAMEEERLQLELRGGADWSSDEESDDDDDDGDDNNDGDNDDSYNVGDSNNDNVDRYGDDLGAGAGRVSRAGIGGRAEFNHTGRGRETGTGRQLGVSQRMTKEEESQAKKKSNDEKKKNKKKKSKKKRRKSTRDTRLRERRQQNADGSGSGGGGGGSSSSSSELTSGSLGSSFYEEEERIRAREVEGADASGDGAGSEESSGARERRRRSRARERRRLARTRVRERREREARIRHFGAGAADIAFLEGIRKGDGRGRGGSSGAVVSHNETMDALNAIVKRQKQVDRRFDFIKKREAGLVAERDRAGPRSRLPAEALAEIKAKGTDPEKMRIMYRVATERHCAELRHELELLRVEASRARGEMSATADGVAGNDEELRTLAGYADVLRSKHEALETKLRTNQRKLLAFRSFDPLYRELESKFGFTSPEDLVDRLKSLEGTHEEFRGKHAAAAADLAALDRDLETLIAEHEKRVSMATVEMQRYLETVDGRRDALEVEISAVQAQLDALQPELDAYLTLYFAVIDVWNWWEATSSLVDPGNALEVPDKLDPILVTIALDNVCRLHVPRAAHELLHQITVISNQLWLKYFPDRDGLKGRPAEVIDAICGNLDTEVDRAKLARDEFDEVYARNDARFAEILTETRELNDAEDGVEFWTQRFSWSKDRLLDRATERSVHAPRALGGGKSQLGKVGEERRPPLHP